MATRQITCYEAVCDLCGTSETGAGYTPHGLTEQAVIDIVTEKWGDPKDGWTVTPDGRLVCDTEDDEAHRTAHEEAGKTISDCAMSVSFASTEPVWWPAVLAATARRRVAAGEMLDHATPTVVDGTLRLHFDRADVAAAWEESGAQTALEAALEAGRWEMPIEVIPNR